MAYAILIKNGLVIDGTGTPPYQADVGILGKRISDIGKLGDTGEIVIDATNQYVTPGFIDLTSHSDTYGTLFASPMQESLLMQGITTVVIGNCGYSLAPITSSAPLEDLKRWTTISPFNIDWGSVGEFYATLKQFGVGVNVATLVGHETLKKNTTSTEEQLLLLARSLEEGAWGLSSNFSFANLSLKTKEEIQELLKIVAQYKGLYKVHLGDEGQNLLPELAEVLALVRAAGVRTTISHFKAIGRKAWKDFKRALLMLDRARQEGLDITFDIFPYLRTGSMLLSFLPPWAREGDSAMILNRLMNPQTYQFILKDLERMTLRPERILIASAQYQKIHVGKTLGRIAQDLGISPESAILELLRANNLAVNIFGKTLKSQNIIDGLLEHAAIIASDGAGYDLSLLSVHDLAHPRSFGAFARFFGVVAPRIKMKPETAMYKITGAPAKALGIHDRGVIAKNAVADVIVFNPETFRDSATYRQPHQYAEGITLTVVNGEIAIQNGVSVKKRFGVPLRRL